MGNLVNFQFSIFNFQTIFNLKKEKSTEKNIFLIR